MIADHPRVDLRYYLLADDGLCVNRMLALKKKGMGTLADAQAAFTPWLPNRSDDDVAALAASDAARFADLEAAAVKLTTRNDLATFEDRIGWKHAAFCFYLGWERDRHALGAATELDQRHFAAAGRDVFHMQRTPGDHVFGTIEEQPDGFIVISTPDAMRWSADELGNRHHLTVGCTGLLYGDKAGAVTFRPMAAPAYEQAVETLRRELKMPEDEQTYRVVSDAILARGIEAFDLTPPTLFMAQT